MKTLYESILSSNNAKAREEQVISSFLMPSLKKRTQQFLKWEEAETSGRTVRVPIRHHTTSSHKMTDTEIKKALYKDFRKNIQKVYEDMTKISYFGTRALNNDDSRCEYELSLMPVDGLKENDYSTVTVKFNVETYTRPVPGGLVTDRVREIVFCNGPSIVWNNNLKIAQIVRI